MVLWAKPPGLRNLWRGAVDCKNCGKGLPGGVSEMFGYCDASCEINSLNKRLDAAEEVLDSVRDLIASSERDGAEFTDAIKKALDQYEKELKSS